MNNRVLIILGMHRSGTSFLARTLHESGLYLGSRLLGKHRSNPGGHYEDRDFLELHNNILADHGLDHEVTANVDWKIAERHIEQARKLVDKRRTYTQWGWKDPRTCLFLPLWHGVIDDPCHFVIYRDFKDVVQSYLNRSYLIHRMRHSRLDMILGKYWFTDEMRDEIAETAARMWLVHNAEILQRVMNAGERYVVMSYHDLLDRQPLPIDQLAVWGFRLRARKPSKRRIQRAQKSRDFAFSLDRDLEHRCEEMLSALRAVPPASR